MQPPALASDNFRVYLFHVLSGATAMTQQVKDRLCESAPGRLQKLRSILENTAKEVVPGETGRDSGFIERLERMAKRRTSFRSRSDNP